MRVSDLLECEVVNEAGDGLGHVHDIRFRSVTGDPVGWSAAALLVGRSGFATRLGYVHGAVSRPWVVAAVFRWLMRHGLEVPWERVVSLEADRIVVSGTAEDFSHPQETRGEEAAT